MEAEETEDVDRGTQPSLWCSVPQTSDACPPALPHLTSELQSHACVADPDSMGTTSTQGFSKAGTCGDLPGLVAITLSPG